MLDFMKKRPASPVSSLGGPATVDHNLIQHPPGQGGEAGGQAVVVDLSKFNKVINFCLYALVLLTPILFLSLTSDVREFNKQALIFLAVVIMLGVWIIKILTTRRVSWVKTSLDYILLAYLGVYLVSSLSSIDKASSFLGYYGRFTGSFISVLSLILLYFLVVNNVKREHTVQRIVNFLLGGSSVVLVYSFFQLLGVYLLPAAFARNRGFNPIGSLVGLAIYAAISVVFMQWIWMMDNPGKLKKVLLAVLTLVALAIMLLVNAFTAWLVLALAMIVFLVIAMTVTSESSFAEATADRQSASSPQPASPSASLGGQSAFLWKPMLILVVSVLFVAFQFLPSVLNPRNLVANVNLPVEIQLSNSTTWTLAANSLKSSAKTAILGSGPGTTGIAFGTIKPKELNNTIVWSLNFDRASSEIAGLVIETGILGLIVFELTALLFLVYGMYFLLKKSQHVGWKYALGFFMLWLALYIAHFFYFFNVTFYFLYWLSIAVFMATAHMSETEEESRPLSFAASPRAALSWMFASLLMLSVILVGLFFQAAIYGGEVAYASGVREANSARPDWAKVAKDFVQAFTLNPYRDVYYLAYGQSLISQAQIEAANPKPDATKIQGFMSELIAAGQQATTVSPANPANWSALAQFYADIKPLAADADKYVISSLKTALDHDPNNPALHYQLGQAYFAAATVPDTSKQPDASGNQPVKTDPAMIKSAEDELNKAIELKPDLAEFYIQLSRVYEADNKLNDAKTKMDTAAGLFPTNPDVLFEDGRLAYNQKDNDGAQKLFERVLALSPDYVNAHYSLGLIAQQKGDKATALAEFQKVHDIIAAAKGDTTAIDQVISSLNATK